MSKKITKLTTKQEQMIEQHIDRCLAIASEPASNEEIVNATKKVFAMSGMADSAPIIICDSPLTVALCKSLFNTDSLRDSLRDSLHDSLRDSLRDSLSDSLYASLYASLSDSLSASLCASLHDSLRDSLSDSLYSSLYASLYASLSDSLYSSLYASLKEKASNLKTSQYINLWWQSWCGWYEFGKLIGAEYDEEKYAMFVAYNRSICSAVLYKTAAIVSRKPTKIQWRNRQLHCDGGQSVSFADGWGLYHLNDVRVPEWLAVTKAEDIDPRKFAEQTNAEVRREFVRKVGIERIAQHCNSRQLDKQGEVYELLSLDLGGETGRWPYLKMLNPSIGVWHMEAVPREIKTVESALQWRNQTSEKPVQLT